MLKPRPWQEPAHSVIVKRFDDLVHIYRFLREDLQELVDTTFDSIAQQIGFVVTTTLPVNLEVARNGKVTDVKLGTAKLEGTLFAREFETVFKKLKGSAFDKERVTAGNYQLMFIWYEALKLKLKHDWMEPVHFQQLGAQVAAESVAKVRPEVQEPAHWFDAGISLETEEELIISAIDEAYPELKLSDRVAMGRYESRKYVPGVREPAHFRQMLEDIYTERLSQKMVPGVREPAHFRNIAELLRDPEKIQLLTELSSLLRKLGI
jgi:hypothetical protein